MGFFNLYSQIRAIKYDHLLSQVDQEKCVNCDGIGFNLDSNSNGFVLLDNSNKCSSCNGSGTTDGLF